MGKLVAGDLRIEGLKGIKTILKFEMEEAPGDHSHAKITGYLSAPLEKEESEAWEPLHHRLVKVMISGESPPLYSGMIHKLSSWEEGGLQTFSLELISGTIQLDLVKKDHSYQQVEMSYGDLIRQVAAQGGGQVICPPELDSIPLSVPRIQYRETDWQFLKRLASHQKLSLYPESVYGGARLYVGVPGFSGEFIEFDCSEYTAIQDKRYFELGGEECGYSRDVFLSYEVESRENYRCGEKTIFQERELTICKRECKSRKGELVFTYRLAGLEWAGQRWLSNEKMTGLSLLGTVVRREGEELRLKLDIDKNHPDQNGENGYPFPWRPVTGNLMYLMPELGSQVSLYFKSREEDSALVINCIRGEEEGEGWDDQYRSLITEGGKQLKLYPDSMGLVGQNTQLLLEDEEGITIGAEGYLRIFAQGKIRIHGKKVALDGGEKGISIYHGHGEEEEEGRIVYKKDAELHLEEEGKGISILGKEVYLSAYEKEDYSGNEYRFRDDPQEEYYDYRGLAVQVMGGLVIVGGVSVATGGIGALLGNTVTAVMGATVVGGSSFVLGLGLTDLAERRISGMDEYVKAALSGSVVGAVTGAAELIPVGGLARAGVDFGAGAMGSAGSQMILDGKVEPETMFHEGVLAAVMAMVGRRLRGGGIGEGGVERWSETTNTLERNVVDYIDETPRLNGILYDSKKLKQLENYLSKRGIELKVGDQFLPPGKAGGFDAVSGKLYLKSNPTQYEVWHEVSHYIQYQQLGKEVYLNLPRTVGIEMDLNLFNSPEQFVYDMLSNSSRRWRLLSFDEQMHANWYIINYGGIR